MTTCRTCGRDVSGKKFCPDCGTAVQATTVQGASATSSICPRCQGAVASHAAFCMHCGGTLRADASSTPPPPPPSCPACHAVVPVGTQFCSQCGHDRRIPVSAPSQPAQLHCANCGQLNAATMRFCGGCGSQLGIGTGYGQSGQYPPQGPYQQPQAYPQPYTSYPQPYPQQAGYQQQPMIGQGQMIVRCPVCMAQAPVGTSNCVSCRTSLAGVVPTPAFTPNQGQQGGIGGMLQGNNGKIAMGVLGGAAAVIGGEMLLHGVENSIEDRVEGDMGYGRHHNRHHRNEGLLGGLGELADDIGLI